MMSTAKLMAEILKGLRDFPFAGSTITNLIVGGEPMGTVDLDGPTTVRLWNALLDQVIEEFEKTDGKSNG